jgi:hypothetical protein
MTNKIKFKTITRYDIEMFDREVNRHLNDGWKLVGSVGVAINSASRDHEYVIAVIKEVEED